MDKLIQSSQLLAELASEAKTKSQNQHEKLDVLSEQIRATDYMASHFEMLYRNTNSVMEATTNHTCMMQCRRHANQLKAELQAVLDAEAQRQAYLRDSV